MFFILCCVLCVVFLCVWPGMVPNQRQLSIVVSDLEPYLGSLFPPVFVGGYFLFCVSAPDLTVRCRFTLCYFVQVF